MRGRVPKLAAALALTSTVASGQVNDPHTEFQRLIPPREVAEELNQFFGGSVSVSGDWLVVGGMHVLGGGAVFFYERQPGGWVLDQALRGQWNSALGQSVAVEGDTAILAAPNHGDWANEDAQGEVFVYQRREGEWTPIQALNPGGLTHFAQFGYAVALDGDTLVVGAPREDRPVQNGGAVYFYERGATGVWELVTEFRMTEYQDPLIDELVILGSAVAVDGDVAVAGAPWSEGGAVVFERHPGTGEWIRVAVLTAPSPNHFDRVGYCVGVARDTVVVGSPGYKYPGSVHVFRRIQGAWEHVQELFASDGFGGVDFGDEFGTSVAMEEDRLLVGAIHGRVEEGFPGRAYLLRRDASGWFKEVRNFEPSQSGNMERLGYSVCFDAGLVAVGAVDVELGGGRPGGVYLFSNDEGVEHCHADINSTGASAQLDLHQVSGGGLESVVHHAPPSCPSLLLLSAYRHLGHRIDSAHLCVGDPILRLGPTPTGPGGVALRLFPPDDLERLARVAPGSTWHFQAVFLDSGVSPAAWNATNAVALTIE